jgi:4-hydroxymandelate oxidase
LDPEQLLNIADYARSARGKLSKEVSDYFDGGALDEVALRENTSGWEGLKLYYRVLAGVGPRDLSTTVLGQSVSMPILVAPTAFQKLACEEGELATARAAKAAKTLFILSSLSNTAMETVFAEAASPRWFQLYIYKDRQETAFACRTAWLLKIWRRWGRATCRKWQARVWPLMSGKISKRILGSMISIGYAVPPGCPWW